MPSIHLRDDQVQVSVNPRYSHMDILEDGGSFLDGAITVNCYSDGTVSHVNVNLNEIKGKVLNIEPVNNNRIGAFVKKGK